MFGNDAVNKKDYSYNFCTKEEEYDELLSGVPRKIQCKCGSESCPDMMDHDLLPRVKEFSKNKFNIVCDNQQFDCDWQMLVKNLFLYDRINDFNDDVVRMKYKLSEKDAWTETDFIITDAEITISREYSQWVSGSLIGLKQRMMKVADTLSFKIHPIIPENPKKNNNTDPNIWVYLEPLPFVPHKKTYSGCKTQERWSQFNLPQSGQGTILLRLTNLSNYYNDHAKNLLLYPQVVNNEINGKKILEIQAFECPRVYEKKNAVKQYKCCHSVYIYFEDSSNSMYFGGGPKITATELQEKGYIPFIKQYRPKHPSGYQKQLECCELTKLISPDRHNIFKW